MKGEVTIQEKIAIVKELEEQGFASTTKKFKISYGTALQWQKDVADFNKPKPKEKLNVVYKNATSIMTPGKGFMNEYDYTLNPYSGCVFGCSYCYAAFFARSEDLQKNWGHWIHVKENALELLKKFRKKDLNGKSIYMSSVTDPYQPIEKELNLTRSLLEELAIYHKPRLVVQTRSPMITRDIDLLKMFENVQVNMTITTDSERVRKAFEPLCPSNAIRLKAIRDVATAGINTCITMTPLLPVEDAEQFADSLLGTDVPRFIIQPFHSEKGKFVAGTRDSALKLMEDLGWSNNKYNQVLKLLLGRLPNLGIGKEGFKPI
jgi:DNA repair photolyase